MTYANLSDEDLVARCAGGDRNALATLYTRYGTLVFSLTVRMLGEGMAAEEVTQDTFMALWRGAHQYSTERGRVHAWLLTIARNRAIDLLRRGRGRHEPVELSDQLHHAVGPEELSLRRVQVRRALAELTPAQREVLELAFYGGMTQQEIAEELATPLGTVKTRMRLGLQRLRSRLIELGETPGHNTQTSIHPGGGEDT